MGYVFRPTTLALGHPRTEYSPLVPHSDDERLSRCHLSSPIGAFPRRANMRSTVHPALTPWRSALAERGSLCWSGSVTLSIRAPAVGPGQKGRRQWAALVVVCVAALIINVDNTILNVALPTLVRQPHAMSAIKYRERSAARSGPEMNLRSRWRRVDPARAPQAAGCPGQPRQPGDPSWAADRSSSGEPTDRSGGRRGRLSELVPLGESLRLGRTAITADGAPCRFDASTEPH